MIISKVISFYSFILMLTETGKRSFENLGRTVGVSGDTMRRRLPSSHESIARSHLIAQKLFKGKKHLVLAIDDTTISKMHSKYMEGVAKNYDTKLRRLIPSYKSLSAVITDGKHIVPIDVELFFKKKLFPDLFQSKETLIQRFIELAKSLFPEAILTVALDGAFTTIALCKWATANNVRLEMRMHSNRVVLYRGKRQMIRNINELKISRLKMGRTIKVVWNDILLYITAVRRIDKHGNETIIFQASTYDGKPQEHIQNYKKRWGIEKVYRTIKQNLGFKECFSQSMDTQLDHMSAVLLAYAMLQLDMKRRRHTCPEDALRAVRARNCKIIRQRKTPTNEIFEALEVFYA